MQSENLYYFDFIRYKLEILIDPSKENDFTKNRLDKIRKKLNKQYLEILEKILSYLQLILFANLASET